MAKRKQAKWDWRAHLTPDEEDVLMKADVAKARWLKLNKARAMITNRAINRAKYRALSAQTEEG